MQYKYRWIYASIIFSLLLLGGYFYDVSPSSNKLMRMHENEKQLQGKLKILQDVAKSYSQQKTKMPYSPLNAMNELMMQIHLSGLSASSIQVLPSVISGETQLHLLLTGHFNELYAFLSALDQGRFPAFILDFSFKSIKQDDLECVLQLILLPRELLSPSISRRFQKDNPFCTMHGSERTLALIGNENKLVMTQSIPLALMKMVGFWQQAMREEALLLLPNNRIIAIQVGDVLGQEQAVVMKMTTDAVSFIHTDGKLFLLEKTK